jgi:hypothetical protein
LIYQKSEKVSPPSKGGESIMNKLNIQFNMKGFNDPTCVSSFRLLKLTAIPLIPHDYGRDRLQWRLVISDILFYIYELGAVEKVLPL